MGSHLEHASRRHDPRWDRAMVPGVLAAMVGVALALLLHRMIPAVGVLMWAVLLGGVAANCGLLPASTQPGLKIAVKKLLRVGVVLLGFSLSVVSIAKLGLPVIALVVTTLTATLLATIWFGSVLSLGRPRCLLIATGFAICGASAIAAMEENADADGDDVAAAISMVTICGTVAMITLPLLQHPLGLTDQQFGVWAGASVHEVGQVVAAAVPVGATAVSLAVAVKLTRVLLLAPVVAGVGLLRRRKSGAEQLGTRPPIVPAFVLGFLVCVALRSLDILPTAALTVIAYLQTLTLGAALFGLGTGVHIASLLRTGGRTMLLASLATVVVGCVSLTGVIWVV